MAEPWEMALRQAHKVDPEHPWTHSPGGDYLLSRDPGKFPLVLEVPVPWHMVPPMMGDSNLFLLKFRDYDEVLVWAVDWLHKDADDATKARLRRLLSGARVETTVRSVRQEPVVTYLNHVVGMYVPVRWVGTWQGLLCSSQQVAKRWRSELRDVIREDWEPGEPGIPRAGTRPIEDYLEEDFREFLMQ